MSMTSPQTSIAAVALDGATKIYGRGEGGEMDEHREPRSFALARAFA
jgi:hypothetical protein